MPGVTYISGDAFYGCSSLVSVSMPNVATVNNEAFTGCSNLTEFIVDNGTFSTVENGKILVKNDGSDIILVAWPAVEDPVTIPGSITRISDYAFSGISTITSVNMNNVEKIGESAFRNSYAITTITGMDRVETIENTAFAGCSSLASIDLSAVSSIGSMAFAGCTDLLFSSAPGSTYSVSGDRKTLYGTNDTGRTLVSWPSASGNITLDVDITEIGAGAFAWCNNLTSIDLVNVTVIENAAFSSARLTSITMEHVISIENYTFESCSSLTSITFPSTVTSIGYGILAQCSSLTDITMLGSSPPALQSLFYTASDDLIIASLTISVPSSAVDAYKAAPGWSTYAANITASP
ncbi:leucine-rich repeat domain-containing protein [Brucepastera parasyntrophica]|uniref:leucine-rich repeat domain-containing protein n=1 Tax=Brucepastera parasyntrophica TaxID=2880008 RepID=UPI00210EEB28|nr:leucine-rich repeat domain-containing protein [Brucepastera parasyntrophica]